MRNSIPPAITITIIFSNVPVRGSSEPPVLVEVEPVFVVVAGVVPPLDVPPPITIVAFPFCPHSRRSGESVEASSTFDSLVSLISQI